MINFISFQATLTTQKYQFCPNCGYDMEKNENTQFIPKVLILIVLVMISVFNHDERQDHSNRS